jgi:hypothetical protein
MRMLIMWACMPFCCIAQNDWAQLMQPSNIVQHKTAQSNPFIHHDAFGVLAFAEHGSIGISVENKYLIASLSKLNISAQYKTENGGVGLHLNALANEIFNGFSLGAGYGVKLSKSLGMGIGCGVRRDQFRGFTPLFILSPQLGLLYLFAKKGSISINLKKLIKPLPTPTYNEFGTFSTAFNFQIAAGIQMGIELENDFRNKSNLNLYAEWSPTQQLENYLYYRTGSAEIQSGLLYIPKRWKMGMGISNHPMLGSSCFMMLYHVLQ